MNAILTNCKVVSRDTVYSGTIEIKNGKIESVGNDIMKTKGASTVDLGGDFLLPGLIEMHTDNLEKNIQPRPNVIWPSILSATLAHDTQVIGAGITTVYDAIAVGSLRNAGARAKILKDSVSSVKKGMEQGLLKADHYIHLRCEIADSRMEEMLDDLKNYSAPRLISIMDHTPGQRQWRDLEKWRTYHRDKRWSEEETTAILSELCEMQKLYAKKNRSLATEFARENSIPLASHDDTTAKDVEIAASEGIHISEFPTTHEAAAKANSLGLKTIMGAPNAIRGLSHSGNVSAASLARKDLLDGLSSDYVPNSLLHSAFHLATTLDLELPKTVAMVSANVADMVGLDDRGEILPGKRADLLQVKLIEDLPVIRRVWKKGTQIA